jgi:hypothetical protein
MMRTPLDEFLTAAKEKGASDEFLVQMLKDRGFPVGEVYQALGRRYSALTGVPIPEARGRLEVAREAFFNLLAFSTLATWLWAAGYLWFYLIDGWFPDMSRTVYVVRSWADLGWPMASLIVVFPVFVWATWRIIREQEADPSLPLSAMRRWLTNIALLLTALVFIGDLVTFLATFLQGDVSARFTLKSVVVLVLVGADFLYYNRGLSRETPARKHWHRGFALASLAAILLTLTLGFLRIGSPANQQLLANDRRRVNDVYLIALSLSRSGGGADRVLPEALPPSTVGIDPFTNRPYEYRRLTDSSYEICAAFSAASPQPPPGSADVWGHTKGHSCFEFNPNYLPSYPVE